MAINPDEWSSTVPTGERESVCVCVCVCVRAPFAMSVL